jgi:hypothetical protein
MPDLALVRAEIEQMHVQVGRRRKEILQLQRAGINSQPTEALPARMLAKIDLPCAERDRLERDLSAASEGEFREPGRSWQAENAEPAF